MFSFQIGTTLTLFERDPQTAKEHLEEADRLIDSIRAELTGLILELRPQALDEKPLHVILREYALDWSHQNQIEVDLDLQSGDDPPLDVKQTLLRILQEALTNAARHSAATNISIVLGFDAKTLSLTIGDDGRGFMPSQVQGGMGLNSMRERAESLGGSLQVSSDQGEGTSIFVVIPQRG